MIELPNHKLAIGDRVFVKLPLSYAPKHRNRRRYVGTITKQGYRADQWVIERDLDGHKAMIHESFITAIREEKAA